MHNAALKTNDCTEQKRRPPSRRAKKRTPTYLNAQVYSNLLKAAQQEHCTPSRWARRHVSQWAQHYRTRAPAIIHASLLSSARIANKVEVPLDHSTIDAMQQIARRTGHNLSDLLATAIIMSLSNDED